MKYENKKYSIDYDKIMKRILVVLPLALCMIGIIFPESAFAAKEDSLKDHTAAIEEFLTGNIMRMSVLGGTVWGAVQSYMAGKFIILASTLGIGLGTCGILSWAKATWAFVI